MEVKGRRAALTIWRWARGVVIIREGRRSGIVIVWVPLGRETVVLCDLAVMGAGISEVRM